MNYFLANVIRSRDFEHEKRILATPGEALPREKPRASSGLTRRQVIAAKQKQYTAALREAKVALQRKRFDEAQALLRTLPPSYQSKLLCWAATHGVRWTS